MEPPLIGDFRKSLEAIVQLRVFSAISDRTHLEISIGNRIRRSQRLANPLLSGDQRQFVGEYTLYVECVWRLDSPSAVLVGAFDETVGRSPVVGAMSSVLNQPIQTVDLSYPALDLVMTFANGMRLTIFCDVSDPGDHDNYRFFTPEATYTVGARSQLS